MKKTCFTFALLFLIQFAFGQAKKSSPVPPPPATATSDRDSIPLEIKIYRSAILFGDYEVARNAIFSLITKYPAKIEYLDTLARIYFSTGAYSQALLAANIYLERDPQSIQMMELCAISQGALNNNKESLEMYERLHAKTKSIFHAYQIAVLQYSLKRLGECEATVNGVINDPQAAKEKININVDQQTSQEVPLAAAALNLRGVLQKELNKTDKAKQDFEASLKLFPEFELAKNNLNAMNNPAPADKEKEKKSNR